MNLGVLPRDVNNTYGLPCLEPASISSVKISNFDINQNVKLRLKLKMQKYAQPSYRQFHYTHHPLKLNLLSLRTDFVQKMISMGKGVHPYLTK